MTDMIVESTSAGKNGDLNSIAEANARIAERYDQMPYISHPFPQSHPARLGAVAHLFGLQAPPVETARVLEIGCASGGNIIPLAASYPDATFVGLELSPVQASAGAARVQRLGLANVDIRHGDVVDYNPGNGEFDYVLCHGVYSWASPPARAAIMRVIASGLAATGIAYVSYNVLPGWRHKQGLRDALMSRVHGIRDTALQIAYTREFLGALKGWNGPDTAYHRDLRETAAHAMTIGDDYLAHEFLENFNEPQTFMQFAEEGGAANLAFLGECEMWMQMAENFDAPTRQLLQTLSNNQILPMEQSIDILTGRTFRQTLLVHGAQAAGIKRTLDPARLAGLHFMGPLQPAAMANPGFAWTFTGASGRQISTNNHVAQLALDFLARRQPGSASYNELLGLAATREDRIAIADALFKSITAGVIDARSAPVAAATGLSERPFAPAWCRSDAEAGDRSIANLRHESVGLDIVGQTILPLLDGAHDWQDLCVALLDKVKVGELRFSRNDVEVSEPQQVRSCVDDHVARTLAQFRARALLAA